MLSLTCSWVVLIGLWASNAANDSNAAAMRRRRSKQAKHVSTSTPLNSSKRRSKQAKHQTTTTTTTKTMHDRGDADDDVDYNDNHNRILGHTLRRQSEKRARHASAPSCKWKQICKRHGVIKNEHNCVCPATPAAPPSRTPAPSPSSQTSSPASPLLSPSSLPQPPSSS